MKQAVSEVERPKLELDIAYPVKVNPKQVYTSDPLRYLKVLRLYVDGTWWTAGQLGAQATHDKHNPYSCHVRFRICLPSMVQGAIHWVYTDWLRELQSVHAAKALNGRALIFHLVHGKVEIHTTIAFPLETYLSKRSHYE